MNLYTMYSKPTELHNFWEYCEKLSEYDLLEIGRTQPDILKRFEPRFLTIRTGPWVAYEYAELVYQGPWPAGERIILQSPLAASEYAAKMLKERWLKFERYMEEGKYNNINALGEVGMAASRYATRVLNRRWIEMEPVMIDTLNPRQLRQYADKLMPLGKWPEAGDKMTTSTINPLDQYRTAKD